MWFLKYKYKHSDCIYSPKLIELGLNVFFHHLNSYIKGNYIYTSSAQYLEGNIVEIKKYERYLKKHKKILKIERHKKIVFVLARHRKDIKIYPKIYNSMLIYPAPAFLDKEGFEITEVASWDRKKLQELIKALEETKTTESFEILEFKEKILDDIYISKLMPKLPKKQKEAIKLAFREGYYKFPKKVSLDKLSKKSKVSKPTYRENLRKAEAKILPKFLPQ